MTLSILMPVGGQVESDPWRARSFDWIVSRTKMLLPDVELVFGASDVVPYSRSRALNDAFARCDGDVTLVVDADTLFHAAQIQEAERMVRQGAPWVVCYDELRYYNLNAHMTEHVLGLPSNSTLEEPTHDSMWDHKITSWSGLVMIPRSAWEAVGGFSIEYIGWGGEDREMQFALDAMVGKHQRVRGSLGWTAHLWHPRGEADFGHPHWDHNANLLRRAQQRYRGVL